MGLQNFAPSRFASRGQSIGVARAAKPQLALAPPAAGLTAFTGTIRASEVCSCRFEAMKAAYGGSVAWLQEWTWASAQDHEGRFTSTIWILRLFGSRAPKTSWSVPWRATPISARFGSAFLGGHSQFTFPHAEVASPLPVWVCAFEWPIELSGMPRDEEEALSEFLRAYV